MGAKTLVNAKIIVVPKIITPIAWLNTNPSIGINRMVLICCASLKPLTFAEIMTVKLMLASAMSGVRQKLSLFVFVICVKIDRLRAYSPCFQSLLSNINPTLLLLAK
ncbi:MAG: hypothetical protein ACP5OK_06410 [Thermoprotei archaeon]